MCNESTFWFSIPNIGPFITATSKGRNEILLMLQRKKYKEMLLKEIENKKLRGSPLGIKFHLRDILGHPDLVLWYMKRKKFSYFIHNFSHHTFTICFFFDHSFIYYPFSFTSPIVLCY